MKKKRIRIFQGILFLFFVGSVLTMLSDFFNERKLNIIKK